MNTKYTAGMLALFLALAAAAYYAGRDREPVDLAAGTATPTPAPLFEYEPTDIQEFDVEGEEGSVTLTRVAGGWEVDGEPANDSIDPIVERLAHPAPLRTLPSDRDPETYGFASPTLTVTLRTQDGEEQVLVYGDETVIDAQVYVRLGGVGDIHMFSSGDWNTMRGWLTNPPLRPTATPEEVDEGTASPEAEGTADATAGPPGPETVEPEPTEATDATPTPVVIPTESTTQEPGPPPTEPPTGATPGGTAPPLPSEAPTLGAANP
jgi:hypothetical protein